MEWIDIISNVGFPIAVVVGLFFVMKYYIDKKVPVEQEHTKAVNGLITEVGKQTEHIDTLITYLVKEKEER